MTLIATTSSIRNDGRRTRYATWLHRYAVGVSISTLILIMIGSTVTTTGSGLAVPDWPTTYGQNMFTYPPSQWVGGIFYEHGHRLVASAVGFLTIGLCVGLWCSAHPRWLKWLGSGALLMVCGQGVLGGLTVLYHLPTVVSVAHAGTAEVFLCMTLIIAAATSARWRPISWRNTPLVRLAAIVLACVYLQIIAGAIMRHTESGLAIHDFPLSFGKVLPPTTAAALEDVNTARVWADRPLPAVTLMQVWVHFAHRVGAVIVTLTIILAARRVLQDPASTTTAVLVAMGLVLLIFAQVVLGALTILTQRSLAMTTAHVGTGAVMLACALGLLLAVVPRMAHSGCANCGYCLTGLGSGHVCPECGSMPATTTTPECVDHS